MGKKLIELKVVLKIVSRLWPVVAHLEAVRDPCSMLVAGINSIVMAKASANPRVSLSINDVVADEEI